MNTLPAIALADENASLKRKLGDLEEQLADLRKQLWTGQHTRDRLPPSTTNMGPTRRPFRFLDLPRELRDAVYKLCLNVGKVYIEHPTSVRIHDMRITEKTTPEQQLFLVCKEIHSEAKEVYVLNNTFVLTSGPYTKVPAFRKFLASIDQKLLRRLSISFDYRDYAAGAVNQCMTFYIRESMRQAASSTDKMQASMADLMRFQTIQTVWFPILTLLCTLSLDYLQVSVENCYAMDGVERIFTTVLDRTWQEASESGRDGEEEKELPLTSICKTLSELNVNNVDIVGTADKIERNWLRDRLGASSSKLRFRGGAHSLEQLEDVGKCVEDEDVIELRGDEDDGMEDENSSSSSEADGGEDQSLWEADSEEDSDESHEVDPGEEELEVESNTA